MPKNAVIGIILKDNNILLTMRRDVPVWTIPGGGIEENETPEDAVLREIKEETGLVTAIKRKVGEYIPINRLSRFTHLYELYIVDGEVKKGPETRDVRFFNLDELPKMPPPYAEWIEDTRKKLPYVIKRKLFSVSYRNFLINIILHPILITRFLLSRLGLHVNSR